MKNNWLKNREEKVKKSFVEEMAASIVEEIDKRIIGEFTSMVGDLLKKKKKINEWDFDFGFDLKPITVKIEPDFDQGTMTVVTNESNLVFSIEAFQDLTSVYRLDSPSIIADVIWFSASAASEEE